MLIHLTRFAKQSLAERHYQAELGNEVNSKLIPTQGNSTNGVTYSKTYSIETTGLKAGVYYCALEEVENDGQCVLHCNYLSIVAIDDNHSVPTDAQATIIGNKYRWEGRCLEQLLAPNTP